MAGEKEVLRYEIDDAGLSGKVDAIKAKLSQVTEAKARGEDTTVLESELSKELESLGAVGKELNKNAGLTGELTKKKEQLAAILNLVGSGLGQEASQLLNMVQLVATGSKYVIGFGAALLGLGTAVGVYRAIAAAQQEAIDKQKQLNDGVTAYKEAWAPVAQKIDEALLKMGALSQETSKAAFETARTLGRQGIPAELAVGAAAVATAAGMTSEQAAQLAIARAQGAQVETPAEAKDVLGRLTDEDRRRIAEQLRQLPETAAGREARAGLGQAVTPTPRPAEEARRRAEALGIVPKGTTQSEFEAMVEKARTAEARAMDALRAAGGIQTGEEQPSDWLLRRHGQNQPLLDLMRSMQSNSGTAAAPEQQPTTVNNYQLSIGTQLNAGDRRTPRSGGNGQMGIGDIMARHRQALPRN